MPTVAGVGRRAARAAERIGVHAPPGSGQRVAGLLAAARPTADWVPVRPGDSLDGVTAVVDLGMLTATETDAAARRARTLGGTRALVAAAQQAKVGRYVLVTSAMVLGATPGPPVARSDEAPAQLPAEDCLLSDLVDAERLLRGLRGRGPAVTVLRPAVLCGAGSDGLLGRHFAGPLLLRIRGGEPCWQFCHVSDLVTALQWALDGRVTGTAGVACDGWLTPVQVADICGLRLFDLPPGVAAATAERLYRLRMSASPASELAFSTWPWVVACDRLRAAGWQPGYDNPAALRAQLDLLAAERASGRGGGLSLAGAGAGAAVAVVGSAAAIRSARRRRHVV